MEENNFWNFCIHRFMPKLDDVWHLISYDNNTVVYSLHDNC